MNLQSRLGAWIESAPVQNAIIALIIANAVTLGLQTYGTVMERVGPYLLVFDAIVLSIFVLEIATKLFAHRWHFFHNPWNVFDFAIVSIALVPATGPLAVLRAFRVLRVLRLLSMVPRLRFVLEALLQAIPGISSIAALLLLFYYVFAVIATGLFGEHFPEWFGSIGTSMYTLFQVMTLESWSMGISRPVMEVFPLAWLFFIPFILLATFTILNLFIAIIVNTMQALHDQEQAENRSVIQAVTHAETVSLESEMRALRTEMAELKALLAEIPQDRAK